MLRALPAAIEPDTWTLAFHRTTPHWWVRLLAVGRFKHVSAFAWVAPYGMWIYYDIRLAGTQIILLPDSETATAWLVAQTEDADLVQMPTSRNIPNPRIQLSPFSCVSAIRHLIGIRSGALPSSLYRACLAHGGVLIHGRARETATEPGAIAPAGAGEG
jgi:hypothetical protein